MKTFLTTTTTLILVIFFSPSYAVKVHQCKDAEGNITFQDICPPGTSSISEKQYGSQQSSEEPESADISATVYLVPDCDTCEEIKDFLQLRKIPFTTKNVNDSLEVQNELKEKTGELKVPVTIIGENAIVGYDRQRLLAALQNAGYVEPEAEQPAGEETGETNEETQAGVSGEEESQ